LKKISRIDAHLKKPLNYCQIFTLLLRGCEV
jgi:hypothetical protein